MACGLISVDSAHPEYDGAFRPNKKAVELNLFIRALHCHGDAGYNIYTKSDYFQKALSFWKIPRTNKHPPRPFTSPLDLMA